MQLRRQVALRDEDDAAGERKWAKPERVRGGHRQPAPNRRKRPGQRERAGDEATAAGNACGSDEHESRRARRRAGGKLGRYEAAE